MNQVFCVLHLIFVSCFAQTAPPATPNGRMFYADVMHSNAEWSWRLTVMFGVSANEVALVFQFHSRVMEVTVPYDIVPDATNQYRLNWANANVIQPPGITGESFREQLQDNVHSILPYVIDDWVITWNPTNRDISINALPVYINPILEVLNPAMQGHHRIGSWIALACSLPAVFHWRSGPRQLDPVETLIP